MKKSLISAIKKLFAKLGAEEVDGNNLVEVIDNGADAIEGGGGSGGGVLKVTATSISSGGTLNKTYDEITAAMDSGKNVIIQATEMSFDGDHDYLLTIGSADHFVASKTGTSTYRIICYVRLQGAVSAVAFSSNSPHGTLTIN